MSRRRQQQEEVHIISKFVVIGSGIEQIKEKRKVKTLEYDFRHVFPNRAEAEADKAKLRKRGVKAEVHDESYTAA